MAAMCACGRYIYSTASNPWSSYTLDEQGRIIKGTCVHGVHFPCNKMSPTTKKDIDVKGGYNGKCNNHISGLISGIGGTIFNSSSQV